MDSTKKEAPFKYNLEVSPVEYLNIKNGKETSIFYMTTEHLSKEPITAKDNPKNRANYLKDVVTGDSIVFECSIEDIRRQNFYIRDQVSGELEVVVTSLNEDRDKHEKTINFRLV